MTNQSRQRALTRCIKEQDKVIDAAKREIDRIKKNLVELAPHKVGDVIEANGYAFKGKKFQIDSVYVTEQYGRWEYRYAGRVLKADGTPGLQTARHDADVFPAKTK
jgi:hypothetical protein